LDIGGDTTRRIAVRKVPLDYAPPQREYENDGPKRVAFTRSVILLDYDRKIIWLRKEQRLGDPRPSS
jgi:hypothetical protein